jgi:hypothetical protein
MNRISAALILAEQTADRLGDLNQFRNDYTLLRSEYGILDSIRGAIMNQDLWGIYSSMLDPAFVSQYWSES